MSLINTEIRPFKATAYHDGEFIPVSRTTLRSRAASSGRPRRVPASTMGGQANSRACPCPQLHRPQDCPPASSW